MIISKRYERLIIRKEALYSAKYFGGLGLRTLNPTIIAEIADFGTKIMTNA
jgi:hypothetical protein